MKLTFPAWKDGHYICLTELLLLLGRVCINWNWYIRIEEVAPEPGAERLETTDPMTPIDIFTLLHLVTPRIQVIDGEITAMDSETSEPLLILRAVDSTSWDIETNNKEILAVVKMVYPEAQEFD